MLETAVGDEKLVSWVAVSEAWPSCVDVWLKQPARTMGTANNARRVSALILNIKRR